MRRGRLRWAVLPASVGLLAMAALLWFTAVGLAKPTVTNVSATLVDAKDHNAPVTGSPQEAAPGSFVAIKVTATLASGQTWRSTSYAFGGGSETCDNDANRSSAGTFTEYVEATLPETTPSPGSVTVRLYAADGCSGTPLASAAVDLHDQAQDRKPGPRAPLRHPGRARARRVRIDRQHERSATGGDQRQQGIRERARRQWRAARRHRVQLERAHRPARQPGHGLQQRHIAVRERALRELHQRRVRPERLHELGGRARRGRRAESETRTGRVPDRRRPDCAGQRFGCRYRASRTART